MSNDLLLLSVEQLAQALNPLRAHPPLFAALASVEDEARDPQRSLHDGLVDYAHATAGEVVYFEPPTVTFTHSTAYSTVMYADHDVPEPRRSAARTAFLATARQCAQLVQELPEPTLARLGVRSSFGTPIHDWVWHLFHLAWDFPDHFARGTVRRHRLFKTETGPLVAFEDWLQLGGMTGVQQDCHPGLIFSRFAHGIDLVTATGYALDLLRRAVAADGRPGVTDATRDRWARLHQDFVACGAAHETLPAGSPLTGLDMRVLRLGSSFRTPPAAAWAGYQVGGMPGLDLFLGRAGCVKEVCVLRGAMADDFLRQADAAGSLLPGWPELPAPPLLADATMWLMRVGRRRELQSQQFYYETPDEAPPHGQPIPRSEVVRRYWESMRPPPGSGGLVTDHRGNVERWLGFVLHTLKEYDPEAVAIRIVPDDHPWLGPDCNAELTLRGLNRLAAN